MKKLLSLLILSILIIGCSKNETESNRHLTFTNFNNGTYKAELTNNHTKIEYTLKCLTKKLDETVYHDDTCGYGVGDSFDENSGFNVDNHKFKEISFFDKKEDSILFNFNISQDFFIITETWKNTETKKKSFELTSTYEIVSSKLIEGK